MLPGDLVGFDASEPGRSVPVMEVVAVYGTTHTTR